MSTTRLDDPVLVRFHQALTVAYNPKLERVERYGSPARGDARFDSDYDVAVPESFGDESGRLATLETDILYENGAVINSLPFHASAYRDRTGLTSELRRDGIDP
jgi:predicted nucleotidyltransferase